MEEQLCVNKCRYLYCIPILNRFSIHLFSISRNASEKGPGETYQVKMFSRSNLKQESARRSV